MLPILIVPDDWYDIPGKSNTPKKSRKRRQGNLSLAKTRRALDKKRLRWRARCGLAQVIVMRIKLPLLVGSQLAELDSLSDCERLLQLLLRRKRRDLPIQARHEIHQVLNDGAKTEVPSSTLCADAATWLLWAMSWRGISSPRQLFAEALHAPTLLIDWWSKMPAPLRFGPTRSLLRALCAVMEQTYRFWLKVASRMRALRTYRLDPRLVTICFATMPQKVISEI